MWWYECYFNIKEKVCGTDAAYYGSNVNNMDIADFYDYLTYLSDIGMEPDLINSFRMLLHSCNNRNPAPELDSITKEQFLLAKKKVYRQAR